MRDRFTAKKQKQFVWPALMSAGQAASIVQQERIPQGLMPIPVWIVHRELFPQQPAPASVCLVLPKKVRTATAMPQAFGVL